MKTFLLALALVLSPCGATKAGMADLFNGVRVGSQLPPHDFKYLTKPPTPGADLTLIDFWATWCAPCRESIPQLNALHAKFAPEGLAMVGVTKEKEEKVRPFLQSTTMLYPLAAEGTKRLHASLGIRAIPYAIFVNKGGKIIWRGQPSEITDALVASLIAKQKGS